MIKINIEMWPFGYETVKYPIADIEIVNRGDHPLSPDFGNYEIRVIPGGENPLVEIFGIEDHKRSDGLFPLLKRIMDRYEKITDSFE